MTTFGKATRGADTLLLNQNRIRVARYPLGLAGRAVKLTAYLRADRVDSGTQPIRGVIYRATDSGLVAASEVLEVAAGEPAGWRDLRFEEPGGVALVPGDYDLGTMNGPGSAGVAVAEVGADDPGLYPARRISATWTDGPPNTLGAGTALTSDLAVFATLAAGWDPPAVPDLQVARYAFPEAQRLLSEGVSAVGSRPALLGWHGTRQDPETGSFAIVRAGGPLEDLVGERLRVRAAGRSVVAYCHASTEDYAEDEEDLTVTRRLFAGLAPLWTELLEATVEVLA